MRRVVLVLGAMAMASLVGCGDDDDEAAEDEPVETTAADEGTGEEPEEDPLGEGAGEDQTLATRLSGEEEVPGPGDPDGSGSGSITLRPEVGEICSQMSLDDIGTPVGAHIHEGVAGEAGPIFLPLETPNPEAERGGCVEADPEKLNAVIDNPIGFYFNVHTEEFPDGAIRGQLEA